MSNREFTTESEEVCACGRSPTGLCIGWHALTKDEFKSELKKWVSDHFLTEQTNETTKVELINQP